MWRCASDVLNDVQRLGGGLERLGESEQLCGSGCSGTIQKLGKVLQGSEDVSNDVQGLERLGDLGQSGGNRLVWHVPEP